MLPDPKYLPSILALFLLIPLMAFTENHLSALTLDPFTNSSTWGSAFSSSLINSYSVPEGAINNPVITKSNVAKVKVLTTIDNKMPVSYGSDNLEWSPDDRFLASAQGDLVRIYDVNAKKISKQLAYTDLDSKKIEDIAQFQEIAWSKNGNQVIAYYVNPKSLKGRIEVWNRSSGKREALTELQPFFDFAIIASPDGRSFLACDGNGQVSSFSQSTGWKLNSLTKSGRCYRSNCEFSNNKNLIAATDDGDLCINQISSEKPTYYDNLSTYFPAEIVRWAPGDKMIAVLSSEWNGQALIFDANTGRLINQFSTGEWIVGSADWTSDGGVLVTTGETSTKFWDPKTGKLLHELKQGGSQVKISHDGTKLAVDSGLYVYILGVTP